MELHSLSIILLYNLKNNFISFKCSWNPIMPPSFSPHVKNPGSWVSLLREELVTRGRVALEISYELWVTGREIKFRVDTTKYWIIWQKMSVI